MEAASRWNLQPLLKWRLLQISPALGRVIGVAVMIVETATARVWRALQKANHPLIKNLRDCEDACEAC